MTASASQCKQTPQRHKLSYALDTTVASGSLTHAGLVRRDPANAMLLFTCDQQRSRVIDRRPDDCNVAPVNDPQVVHVNHNRFHRETRRHAGNEWDPTEVTPWPMNGATKKRPSSSMTHSPKRVRSHAHSNKQTRVRLRLSIHIPFCPRSTSHREKKKRAMQKAVPSAQVARGVARFLRYEKNVRRAPEFSHH